MQKYNPSKIEKKWQAAWQKQKLFLAHDKSKKKKKYVLFEFPYPSGAGLHVGHMRPYVASDIYARFSRLEGYEVLYPMGWDAFGLPAENYALKQGVHPAVSTAKNIKNAKRQIQSWGISLDWTREINTTDPEYYKWTQWLFLQFFKAGLAYEATGLINWCPKDKTGLANEEVIDGKCERCGSVVQKKELRQWYLKITAYAENLLEGLEHLPDWPEQVKLQQANWIGKSVGAEIDFAIGLEHNKELHIGVFTTRPDTLFGVTYVVLAPEHPMIQELKSSIENWKEVAVYIAQTKTQKEIDRTAADKEKTGVELKGVYAINPATAEPIPMWIADYVLGSYGTGAVMAVPAHDQRDMDFAVKFGLAIKAVITINQNQESRIQNQAYEEPGTLKDSGKFSGMQSEETLPLMAKEYGKFKVQYKLRDWVFSRQRYWGEPIPLVHCEKCGVVAVPDKDLPVLLPKVKKYEPTGTGESPLASIEKWVKVKCPNCKGPALRETNTMPQWAGSSWYFLRYADSKNKKEFAKKELLTRWMPVDVYFGGMEHTTLHLLYSRFWNLFLYDQKLVPVSEPYTKRVPHGIILAADGEKMSKSKGNVVNPDDIAKEYGIDALRMYEMFLGPHEAAVAWNDQGIVGVRRFLERIYSWISSTHSTSSGQAKQEARIKETQKFKRELNKLIKKITEDIENFRFNTAVAAFMEFYNDNKDEAVSRESLVTFLTLLYPFAPHIAEELHAALGYKKSLQLEKWPKYDTKLIVDTEVQIVVQINGKTKGTILVPSNSTQAQIQNMIVKDHKFRVATQMPAKRIIFVPNRLINFVL